ncbi:MAG: HEAT repeat domain-containing protein [Planctomycetota bacterium]
MKYPACLLLTILVIFPGLSSQPAAADPGTDEKALAIIGQIKKNVGNNQLVRDLAKLGPEALATIRSGIKKGPGPVSATLVKARNLIISTRVAGVLQRGIKSQLSFDGQYNELAENRTENIEALFFLLNDESSPYAIRHGSCRALADIGDKSLLPRLRQLYWDILLDPDLRNELGIILAIFGDTTAIDNKLTRYSRFTDHQRSLVRLSANIELSNLYYRIRNYARAIEAYEKILELSEKLLKTQRQARVPQEVLREGEQQLNLHYYNAACSNSLGGNLERAKKYLLKAVQGNPEHYGNIGKDGDLINLRKDPGFPAFMKKLGRLFEDEEI